MLKGNLLTLAWRAFPVTEGGLQQADISGKLKAVAVLSNR
jgi:hypothetical protein